MPLEPAQHDTSMIRVVRCGPYRLGRRIGAGGMATVFAARQEGPSGVARLVAVKILSAAISDDPTFQRMFLREARIAARLEHPNIVRVYDVGEANGEVYVAMEYVHGAPLSRLSAGGAAPIGVALRIAADVARGLHAAHELADVDGGPLGLVHQDVSPQNVLVGYDGTVKLLDFGVAHLTALDTSRVEGVRGKPAYLAPEQLQSGRVDRRTDVFALGIVLHELLTGQRLFQRTTAAASLVAILNEAAPDVRTARSDVPARVAALVARALERDPEARFPTAEAMRREMGEAMAEAHLAADDGAVAAWAREAVPPALTPSELEREIVDGGPNEATPLDIADLATIKAPLPVAVQERAPEPSRAARTRTRAVGVAAGVMLAGAVAGSVWFARARATAAEHGGASTDAPAPGPANASVSAPPSAQVAEAPPDAANAEIERPPSSDVTAAARPPSPLTSGVPHAPRAAASAASSASASAATQPGHVSVWSNTWGHVRIDGVSVGDSPVTPRDLAAGPHTIAITTERGAQEQHIVVAPGEDKKVRFVF